MEVTKEKALEEAKKSFVELGKDEGEDVLKGAVEIGAKLVLGLAAHFKFLAYVVPFLPMIKSVLIEAIDKIDGEEG